MQENRDARNAHLENLHESLKEALSYARKCDPDDSDDRRILEWIEGTLEEFGDDVEDVLDGVEL